MSVNSRCGTDGNEPCTLGRDRLAKLDELLIRSRQEVVERQVIAAKFEQRVEMLRQQAELARRNRQERERALAEMRERLATQQTQLAELDEKHA